MRWYSVGLESLKQEAGSEQSWSIVFLGVSCSWEEKKRTQGCSVGLRKGRQPQVLCVRVMSRVPGTSRNTVMNFTCGHLGKLGSLREGGEREQPGATGRGALLPCPPHSPSFLGLPPLLLTQGPSALQSSSHCDLVGGVLPWNLPEVGVEVLPWNLPQVGVGLFSRFQLSFISL